MTSIVPMMVRIKKQQNATYLLQGRRGHDFFVKKDQVMNSFIDILIKRGVGLLAESRFFKRFLVSRWREVYNFLGI